MQQLRGILMRVAAVLLMALPCANSIAAGEPAASPLSLRLTFESGASADVAGGPAAALETTGTTRAPGRQGRGLHLPLTGRVVYDGEGNLALAEGSIETWVKPDWSYGEGRRGQERWFLRAQIDASHYFYLRYRGGHELVQFFWRNGEETGGQQKRARASVWQKDQWLHLLASWQPNAAGAVDARVFINGQAVLSASGLKPFEPGAEARLIFGGFDGVLDDVSVYNRALRVASASHVDLAPVCNAGLRNDASPRFGVKEEGENDLRSLPTGEQIFRGIPFRIVDPSTNAGRALVLLRGRQQPNAPSQVRIPVGKTFRTAYLLGASSWTQRGVNLIVEVRYDDGHFESIPLRGYEDLIEWSRPKDTDRAFVAWEGSNPLKPKIGLCFLEWENPRPTAAVTHFLLKESGNDTTPFLAAITLTDQAPQFVRLRGRGAPVEERILLVAGRDTTTATALKKLNMPFQSVPAAQWETAALDKVDVLVFGCRALANCNTEASQAKLKSFVEDGGAVLSFDRGLVYRWRETGLSHGRAMHFLIEQIEEPKHPVFQRPNPLTVGDLENIYHGRAYSSLVDLGPDWRPLVKTFWCFMNPAKKAERETTGIAVGAFGKGVVTYCCMVPSRDWIISDAGSWGSNGGKLFENLIEWSIACSRKARGKPAQQINGRLDRPKAAPDGWVPYRVSRSTERHFPVDLSHTVERPAGKHGFVRVGEDARLVFADGTPARFFGIQTKVPGEANVEQWLDRAVMMGANCIRFFIQPRPRSNTLLTDLRRHGWQGFSLDDRYFAEAKKRGLHFYIVIEDWGYGDGNYVTRPKRKPKGVIFIDEETQHFFKAKIRTFLLHKNEHTGLRYVDDPAIVFLELFNENSLTTHMAGNVLNWPEPFRSKIKAMWNEWLLEQYAGRAGLARAWTNLKGECALHSDEDPARGSVVMADLHKGIKLIGTGWDRDFPFDHKQLGPARLNDFARFVYGVERRFYESVIEHLRDLGFRQPVFGTGYAFAPFGLKSQGVLPMVSAGGSTSGRALFVGPEHANVGPIEDRYRGFAANALADRPLVNREWYARYPETYCSLGIAQMFLYSAFQGYDGIFFHHGGSPIRAMQHAGGDVNDPARAGVMAVMGLILRRGDIQTGRYTAEVALSPTDTYYAANWRRQGARPTMFRYLPYIHRVRNRFVGEGYKGKADVVFTSGLSSNVDLRGVRRAFVSCDNPFQDLHNKARGRQRPAALLCPGLSFGERQTTALDLARLGAKPPGVEAELLPGILTRSLPAGAAAFGVSSDGQACLGYMDDRHVIAPYMGTLERKLPGVPLSCRAYLAAAKRWGLIDYGPEAIDQGVLTTDTGQVRKHWKERFLAFSSPRSQGAHGFLGARDAIVLDDLTIRCETSFANIVATSLTDAPLATSGRILLLAVGHAGNTGEEYSQAESWVYDPVNALKREQVNMSMVSEGRLPIVVEPIEAQLELRCRRPKAISPLAEDGARRPGAAFTWREGKLALKIGREHRTVFYEIVCE